MFQVALSVIILVAVLVVSKKAIKSTWAKVSSFATAGAIGRITSSMHGFQPLTSSIIFAAKDHGPIVGMLTGVFGTLISSIFLGIGLWVIPQAILWGSLGLVVGFMKDKFNKYSLTKLAAISFVYQIIFGIVMDVSMFYLFQWLVGSYMYTSVIAAVMGGMLFNLRAGLFSTLYTLGIGVTVQGLNYVLEHEDSKSLVKVN